MPDLNLEAFKTNLYDICRPNRFKVSIDVLDTTIAFADTDYYFVKGASLPGKTLGEVELNWQGHKYKLVGDPTFSDVTITFWNNYEENGENVRDTFEKWFALSSEDDTNVRGLHTAYKCSVYIEQINNKGDTIKCYKLVNAHPKELSDIELSMDTTDAVEEFTVVFSYSYVDIGDTKDSIVSNSPSSTPV